VERRGDFSSTRTAIRDPQTGEPFAGNQIPITRFDTVANNVLSQNLMPLPNRPDGQLVQTYPTPQNSDQINIGDPARPKILKKISDRPRIDLINGMALRGAHVLSANKSGFVSLFDVRNPADPVYLGSLNTKDAGGPQRPHDIAIAGDHAIVVDADRNRPASVFLYRIADPKTHHVLPIEQWALEASVPNTADQDLQGANRVAVWGRYASVGAFVQDRVGIIDVADPRKPRQVANLPVCDIDATGMTVSGRVVFVSGGECVEAIDVSDPTQPVSVAQYRGGRLFPTRRSLARDHPRYDNSHDLVYRGGYLYVTAQNDNRFGIIEVLDRKLRDLAEPQVKKQ
jgi:hypothetical protein